ncbi:NAC domain-containing protein [Actinidia chinensis var. chinensis]|uniref:NAC domain-containing protein n=1 Tax=Actinidia chinensis var. chinensis TaxID=1590841 RepID=A0A2R6R0S6_ACTCC|nr:NAC domain-containing protein [Actinidia chinensis var. chinensis]
MENPNFGRNGGFKFPIGFRFRPTDEELVVHYLKRKVHSLPLPALIIPELHVFHTNPWDLPGDLREKRYFFSTIKGNLNKCQRISTGSGYWKAIGKEKHIVGSNKRAVGVRKTLVFYGGKPLHGLRTNWVMHQYGLVGSETTTPNTTQKIMGEEWVVCCIYQRRRKSRKAGGKIDLSNGNKNRNVGNVMACILDISSDSGHPQASSDSCLSSSEITAEVSSKESDHEEAASANISFSTHLA